MPKRLSSTLEDYLNTVYRLEQENRVARPRDIARIQNVARSTVTAALQSLAKRELLNYQPYETISLTSKGRRKAREMALRRQIIVDFLENVLGLDAAKAKTTACEMEHAIEEQSLQRFSCFLAFLHQHAPDGPKWLRDFRKFARKDKHDRTCKKCVETYLRTLQNDPHQRRNH